MMTQVHLPVPSSLLEIERAMHNVARDPQQDLWVSKDYASKRLGAINDAARLQLLATWARLKPQGRLAFHAANSMQSVLNELCECAPGIVALRMCQGVRVGVDSVDRRDALAPAVGKMNHTNSLELEKIIKGRTIDFCCVSGSKVQYLRPLFNRLDPSAVKGEKEMFSLLSKLSEFITKSDAKRVPKDFLAACSIFASELLQNTQDHATRDRQARPYLEHVEGLIMSWYDETQEDDFSSNEKLRSFWVREKAAQEGGDGLRTLQLSFFDTGPGFASRFSGKAISELSLKEERDLVLHCLRKNETTKRQAGAGNGFPEVLSALRRIGGLIAIRTGRLRLFSAFEPGEAVDQYVFDDWYSEPLAEAVGAVVSIMVPIRR
jgi:hypothetical protein